MAMLHDSLPVAPVDATPQQAKTLHVAFPSECNVQHSVETAGHRRDWTLADVVEVEQLIDLVAPSYSTATDEVELMKTIARGDVASALTCFRDLAGKVKAAKAFGTIKANDKPKLGHAAFFCWKSYR